MAGEASSLWGMKTGVIKCCLHLLWKWKWVRVKKCFGCIRYKNKHVIRLPQCSYQWFFLCIYLVTLSCVFVCSFHLTLKTVKINKKSIDTIDFHRELTAAAGIKLHREIMTCQRGGSTAEQHQIYETVSQSTDINAAAHLNKMHKYDEDSPAPARLKPLTDLSFSCHNSMRQQRH